MSIITAILKNNWIEKLIKNKPNDMLITILLPTKNFPLWKMNSTIQTPSNRIKKKEIVNMAI